MCTPVMVFPVPKADDFKRTYKMSRNNKVLINNNKIANEVENDNNNNNIINDINSDISSSETQNNIVERLLRLIN